MPASQGVLTLLVHGNSGLDLLKLIEDEGVGLVTVGMVVGESVEGLSLLTLGHEPPGRLWCPKDKEELEDGRETLKDGWNSPRPVVLDELSTKGCP